MTAAAVNAGYGEEAVAIASRVEAFVRTTIASFERDDRRDEHGGPAEALVGELRNLARNEGLLTPHVRSGGSHFSHLDTMMILRRTGLSALGPIACNTAAPDEGNMYLLARVGSEEIKARFLQDLLAARRRSAFFMTEPAEEGGAGSDPSMLTTSCRLEGDDWIISGRKAFITGAEGAGIGIVMAKSDEGACMFVVDLPDPAITIDHVVDTIDSSMPGGHAVVTIRDLRVPARQMLGESGEGFKYAQVRLAPARLSHCARWLGTCIRANEIATDYACRRQAFGKALIDHEGVGFMLADNLVDLRQADLMIDWCARVLDAGSSASIESSMTKAAVSEALFRVADRCVQVMGGNGVSRETMVEQTFRELRAFRIYDGPTEVHKWSLAKSIKRSWKAAQL